MKSLLKTVGLVIMLTIVLGCILSSVMKPRQNTNQNYSSKETSLSYQIQLANEGCPIPVAGGSGQLSAIKLEGDYVVFYADYHIVNPMINACRENPDAARDLLYLSSMSLDAQNMRSTFFMNLLLSKNKGIKIVLKDVAGSSFSSTMTPEYIKYMKSMIKKNPSQALHDAFELKLFIQSKNLPLFMTEGMWMTSIKLEDKNMVIECTIDENIYDMNYYKDHHSEVLNIFIDELKSNDDPESAAFFDMCKISHSGIIYRIIGNNSKKEVDFVISSEIIRKTRKLPSTLNIN